MLNELYLILGSQQQFEIYLFDDNEVAYDLSSVVSATVTIRESSSGPILLLFESGTNLTIGTGLLTCNTTSNIDWTDIDTGAYIAEVKLEDSEGIAIISERFIVHILKSIS